MRPGGIRCEAAWTDLRYLATKCDHWKQAIDQKKKCLEQNQDPTYSKSIPGIEHGAGRMAQDHPRALIAEFEVLEGEKLQRGEDLLDVEAERVLHMHVSDTRPFIG
jgi:hypothetical protein